MNGIAFMLLLCAGVVDKIEDNVASVEVVASDRSIHDFDMSTLMFPCEIKEGDTFYFVHSQNRTEIRCGPPSMEGDKQ